MGLSPSGERYSKDLCSSRGGEQSCKDRGSSPGRERYSKDPGSSPGVDKWRPNIFAAFITFNIIDLHLTWFTFYQRPGDPTNMM